MVGPMPSEAAIQAPPGEPSNALVDGSCAPEITPVPRPGDYLQIEIDHWGSRSGTNITDPKKGENAYLSRLGISNPQRAYQYSAYEIAGATEGRRFTDTFENFRQDWRHDEDRVDKLLDYTLYPQGWTSAGAQIGVPGIRSLSLPSTLTREKTPAAPCIYESHPPDRSGYSTSNTVISYVNADGWMFQQVETKKAKGTNWIFHNRYVFKIVEPFTIERPQPGSKEVNYFSD
jgi:hypothetical protein